MEYVIQYGLFRGAHEEALIKILDRFGFTFHFFKHVPFSKELVWINADRSDLINSYRQFDYISEGTAPTAKNIIAFGSVAFSHFANEYGWQPGSFYNDNHDYTVYSKYWKENMLNWDSKIQKLSDPVHEEFFFARPTGDNKIFKGECYDKDTWDYMVGEFTQNGGNTDSLVQISKPKEIMQEVRCFVIKGKVITASYYKIGNSVTYKECHEEDILAFAQEMVDVFQLADAFVIDICRTDKGLKIVECNCFNCSGFYAIDMQKLISALEENFNC